MTLIPDIEKLVSNHLRGVDALEALSARVVGKTPDDPDSTPWVRVTKLDGGQSDTEVDHLVGFYLQLDCYADKAGGQPKAIQLGRTVRAALTEMQGVFAEGIVSGARIEGDSRIPDTTLEPARERVILTATVYAHG